MTRLPERRRTHEELMRLREEIGVPGKLEGDVPARPQGADWEPLAGESGNPTEGIARPAHGRTKIPPPRVRPREEPVMDDPLRSLPDAKIPPRQAAADPTMRDASAPDAAAHDLGMLDPVMRIVPEPAPGVVLHGVAGGVAGQEVRLLSPGKPESADEPHGGVVTEDRTQFLHTLRRSDRGPIRVSQPQRTSEDSPLPTARHSEAELMEIKRRALIAVRPPVSYLNSITAPVWLLAAGYVLALLGGVGGLLVAAMIASSKRRSRHHAGFITAMSVLVLVFGSLFRDDLWNAANDLIRDLRIEFNLTSQKPNPS